MATKKKRKSKSTNSKSKTSNTNTKSTISSTTNPDRKPGQGTVVAVDAVNQLRNSLRDRNGNRFAINDLDSYVTDKLRQDYREYTDTEDILRRYNAQSDASWDLARAEQIQAMNRAENQNYANTQNAIAQMRNSLAGSAASGGSRGAANATALQALLGLGQQNSAATTEGMQSYQNAAREAAASRAANAVTALSESREGMNSMYNNATSAYGADHTYGTQGIAEAAGSVASAVDTNASNELMNRDTNATNLEVARTPSVNINQNTNKDTSKSTNVNKNYNYEGKK